MQSVIGSQQFREGACDEMALWSYSRFGQCLIPSNLQVIDVGYLCGVRCNPERGIPLAEGYP